VKEEGSLAAYFWRFEPKASERASPRAAAVSAASIAMSKNLKKRDWSFVGPTTVYAFMQAMGLINDHAEGCVIRDKTSAAKLRSGVRVRPTKVRPHPYIHLSPGSRF
jgi:DNA-3-methyladenine glycosylase I